MSGLKFCWEGIPGVQAGGMKIGSVHCCLEFDACIFVSGDLMVRVCVRGS
jgi:hypothetical protein